MPTRNRNGSSLRCRRQAFDGRMDIWPAVPSIPAAGVAEIQRSESTTLDRACHLAETKRDVRRFHEAGTSRSRKRVFPAGCRRAVKLILPLRPPREIVGNHVGPRLVLKFRDPRGDFFQGTKNHAFLDGRRKPARINAAAVDLVALQSDRRL